MRNFKLNGVSELELNKSYEYENEDLKDWFSIDGKPVDNGGVELLPKNKEELNNAIEFDFQNQEIKR